MTCPSFIASAAVIDDLTSTSSAEGAAVVDRPLGQAIPYTAHLTLLISAILPRCLAASRGPFGKRYFHPAAGSIAAGSVQLESLASCWLTKQRQ